MYTWGGTRTLPQGCTIVSWLLLPCLCIPSLPWLATVQICPLELREGPGVWGLFPRNGGQKGFCAQEPHRVLLSFSAKVAYFGVVIESKFMCLVHSEAKQTETLEFGGKKGLFQGQASMCGSCSKDPNSLMFSGRSFYRQNLWWGLQGVWLSSDWLVVRYQGGAPGILCSAWSYHPPPGWRA